MIRITALDDGFRRAGMAHSATPTEHPDDTFSQEQLQELQAEPLLLVEVLPDTKVAPAGEDEQVKEETDPPADTAKPPAKASSKTRGAA
ncbi:HI1506-related protein [Aquitalea sp. ASV15]|uniref:HI1506-related protein n=1 Tax=Aquitalea sp. ASV15 TaxID=2795104 RepID=UPI0018EB4D8E|nr:HI1506-related protein [Aquitalea sp. ASV15]